MKIILYIFLVGLTLLLLQPKGGTWAYLLNIRWLYVFMISFLISLLLLPLTIKLANKYKLFDHPNERKIHKVPTPMMGGVAIFLAITITCVRNLQLTNELIGILLGGTLIYVIGLINDIKPLSATVRLISQVLASIISMLFGLSLTILPHIPLENFLEYVLTILWLVGLTNTINFLDGIDGLAASLSFLCSFFLFITALITKQTFLTYPTIAICGASLAFLIYNWHPAKLFMGDAGANFLGFMLGGLSIMGTWGGKNPIVAFTSPLLILSIPIYDIIYTTFSRIKNKQIKNIIDWFEYTAKDHIHHRIMNLGFNQPQTVILILTLNGILGVSALAIPYGGAVVSLLLLLQSVFIFVIISILMLKGRGLK